jgi:uroporphyrinogen-III decarboxylase
MSEEDALKDLYGVDIMRDNVDLCKKRLGGGTILMGNALDPAKILDGQTDAEHEMMRFLFLAQTTVFSAKIM